MSFVQKLSDWFAKPPNLVPTLVLLLAISVALSPIAAHAQVAGGDAGTILQAAVTYFEGNFGIALASIGMIIIAILLFVGQHRYESLLLAVVAVAIYFGGPGLITKIAGGAGG